MSTLIMTIGATVHTFVDLELQLGPDCSRLVLIEYYERSITFEFQSIEGNAGMLLPPGYRLPNAKYSCSFITLSREELDVEGIRAAEFTINFSKD